MVTLHEGNSIDDISKELAEIFGRYKSGEISREEYDQLGKEVLERDNREKAEALATLEASIGINRK